MSVPVLPSTFFLTLLLLIGLFFFLKASVKDRTQRAQYWTTAPEETLLDALKQYFSQRAYRVVQVDRQQELVTLEGLVRPSVFLAFFLTLLAATGLFCLGLVIHLLLPQIGPSWLGLGLLSPLVTGFYWQRARRPEQVSFKLDTANPATKSPSESGGNILTVTAHRDELLSLEAALQLERLDEV